MEVYIFEILGIPSFDIFFSIYANFTLVLCLGFAMMAVVRN